MSANGLHRISTTRTVRKIEAPRPLKTSSFGEPKSRSCYLQLLSSYTVDSVEKLFILMDMVVNSITQAEQFASSSPETTASVTANIIHLCKHLKIYGSQLESPLYQGQLDRAFLAFREAMVRGCLDYEARAHLLEIIELRECHWIPRKALSPIGNCYSSSSMLQSLQELDDYVEFSDIKRYHPLDATANLSSDEVIKRSAKHREKSSKVSSKNYFKDEVVIRNSDSGKVMGIKGRRVHMIEQLSETIISFQRVPPTAKERLVQITGPNEERISYATRLIEDTIRNNSSPVRDLSGSESSYSSEDSGDPQGFEDNENEIAEDESGTYPKWPSNINSTNRLAPTYQYTHKVIVKNCQLTITGDDYAYVTVAKDILDNYFSKLRKSEFEEEEDIESDDVFLYDTCTKNEDLKKLKVVNTPPVSQRTNNFSLIEPFDFPDDCVVTEKSPKRIGQNVGSPVMNCPSSLTDYELKPIGMRTRQSSVPEEPFPSNLITTSLIDAGHSVSLNCDVVDAIEKNSIFPESKEDESRVVYSKEFLLECRKSKLSNEKPENWENILSRFPQIVKETEEKATNNEK